MARLLAIALITAGLLFLLDNFGLIDFELGQYIALYWPLLFVYLGIRGLMKRVRSYGWRLMLGLGVLPYIFLILLGGTWVAGNLGKLAFGWGTVWSLAWPLLIIGGGIMILTQGFPSSSNQEGGGVTQRSTVGSYRLGDGTDYWELKPMRVKQHMGEMYIDLTRAKIDDIHYPIHLSLHMGSVRMILPEGLEYKLIAEVKSGSINLMDHKAEGFHRRILVQSDHYDTAERKVTVEIQVKLGEIKVQRAG